MKPMPAEGETDETIQPWPPRYWWLRRIVATSLLFVVCVGITWGMWAWRANRRLEAQLHEYKSRGEPITWAEFTPPKVPDAENGAMYLLRAVDAVSRTVDSPSDSNFEFPSYLPMPPEWLAMEQKALSANTAALQQAREARAHPSIAWPMGRDPLDLDSMGLVRTRVLANVLADAAIYHHLMRNDAEALRIIDDILFLADAIGHSPGMVSQLVSTGDETLATSRLGMMAPALSITSDGAGESATRAQVEAIIEKLLNDDSAARWERSLVAERVALSHMAAKFKGAGPVLRTLFIRKELAGLETVDAVIDDLRHGRTSIGASAVPPLGGLLAALSATPTASTPTDYLDNISWGGTSSYQRYLLGGRSRVAIRRAAAISLAVRLYRADHEGAWPASLESLVPAYLTTVPVDPLSLDNKPFRYLITNGGKRPILLGVGNDRQADFTDQTPLPAHPVNESSSDLKDFVWDVSRFEPSTPFTPSEPYAETQRKMEAIKDLESIMNSTANDQPEQANEEGKQPTGQRE